MWNDTISRRMKHRCSPECGFLLIASILIGSHIFILPYFFYCMWGDARINLLSKYSTGLCAMCKAQNVNKQTNKKKNLKKMWEIFFAFHIVMNCSFGVNLSFSVFTYSYLKNMPYNTSHSIFISLLILLRTIKQSKRILFTL